MDRWETVTDRDLTSLLLARVVGSGLQPLSTPSPRLCHSCATIDFKSSKYDLQGNLEDLQTRSSECFLCQFLYRRLSANDATPEGPLTLHRVGSTIRISSEETPIISLYCDTGKSTRTIIWFRLTDHSSRIQHPRPPICTARPPCAAGRCQS